MKKYILLLCLFVILFKNGIAQSKSNFQTSDSIDFKLKFYIHGYYLLGGSMKPVLYKQRAVQDSNIVDTIHVNIHHHASPYKVLYSSKALLHTNGMVECKLKRSRHKHYLSIETRNALLTFSSKAIRLNRSTIFYDFTTQVQKAYGNNMIQVEKDLWAFYSSDANQDGKVNDADVVTIVNSANDFLFGFQKDDINGDANVDLLDQYLAESYLDINKDKHYNEIDVQLLEQNPHLRIVTKFPERKITKLLKDNTFLKMLNTIF